VAWGSGQPLEGTLSYDQTKFLSGLADFRALIQNLRTVELARANAEYWLHPRGNSPTYRGALAGGGECLRRGRYSATFQTV
jgi:hypothetical protein